MHKIVFRIFNPFILASAILVVLILMFKQGLFQRDDESGASFKIEGNQANATQIF